MAKTHPPYPPAFQAEAVALARTSGKGSPHLAQDLGISEQALRGGVKRSDIDAGRGQPGELTGAEREACRIRSGRRRRSSGRSGEKQRCGRSERSGGAAAR